LNDSGAIAASVRGFYERTSEYELDAWSEWCGLFRPLGRALALLFSRRLQQLNIPLSPLDSSKGISSAVLQWRDPNSGSVVQTAWVRELQATNNVLYAGSYSVCRVPGYRLPCVKVVFPLPNGNAIVLMKPEAHADGSFSVTSAGRGFGDPGFYFVVHGEGGIACQDLLNSISLFLSNRILRVHFSYFGIQPLDFGSQVRDKLRHLIFVARYGKAGRKVI
jgi:hypothetical protein